jgi:hypothetical protein
MRNECRELKRRGSDGELGMTGGKKEWVMRGENKGWETRIKMWDDRWGWIFAIQRIVNTDLCLLLLSLCYHWTHTDRNTRDSFLCFFSFLTVYVLCSPAFLPLTLLHSLLTQYTPAWLVVNLYATKAWRFQALHKTAHLKVYFTPTSLVGGRGGRAT